MTVMGMGGGMGLMWIIWLVVLVGIVLLVVLAVRAFGGYTSHGVNASGGVTGGRARSRARDVLDERYARGEMTTEEYRERLTALGEDMAG